MATRDLIVIGASAGGVPALKALVRGLPGDLDASVLIVQHLSAHTPSMLPHVLATAGPLKAVHPRDGAPLRPGLIYVAPPDLHMMVEDGRVTLHRGPRENRHRPSIDALFRSAANAFGPRVVGVILSGLLDDGTSGLWTIKRMGGLAVVQDPGDAEHAGMPVNAMSHVDVDHVAPAIALGPALSALIREPPSPAPDPDPDLNHLAREAAIPGGGGGLASGILGWGPMSPFTCPECHGTLVTLREGTRPRYRCHTGHAYSASALLASITESVEETLWSAMRGIEEQAILLEHISGHLRESGHLDSAARFREKALRAREQAEIIHGSLPSYEQQSGDSE